MHSNKRLIFVLLLALAVAGVTALASQRLSQTTDRRLQRRSIDTAQFPIADYERSEIVDPEEKARRHTRGRRYDNALDPLTERTEESFSTLDWEVGLSALPVDKSPVVVIGEVTDAQAHLSNDRTGVYSEFVINVDSVLKNDINLSLSPSCSITTERFGGRVRFRSGRVALVHIRGQGMPRVGGRYLFFLTQTFPLRALENGGEALYILTGYELRHGRVFPLDAPPEGHPINGYRGVTEQSLLSDLRLTLSNPC